MKNLILQRALGFTVWSLAAALLVALAPNVSRAATSDAEIAAAKANKQAAKDAEAKAKALAKRDAEDLAKAQKQAQKEAKAKAEAEKKAAKEAQAKLASDQKSAKEQAKKASATKAEPSRKATEKVEAKAPPAYPAIGSIERLDPEVYDLIPTNAVIEKLAEGFKWSEGPVWMGDALLFSDVPQNTIFQWRPGAGVTEFLCPSGYTGSAPREREMGSNGLLKDSKGRLVICQHGDRQIVRLDGKDKFTVIASLYQMRRFNSPNDATYHSSGDLYFTDPTYGLEKGASDPLREIPFCGVYRVSRKGEVTLLSQELKCPNGIAFSPQEDFLFVANSDPANPVIMVYPVLPDGKLSRGWVFFDAKELAKSGKKGLPDGLKVDQHGNLFATGPGGVLIISRTGKLLGVINTGEPTANCAFGDRGELYITANKYLCRVQTLTRPSSQGFFSIGKFNW